jgi:hypothetical protein
LLKKVFTLSYISPGQETALLRTAAATPLNTPAKRKGPGWKKIVAYTLAGVTISVLLLITFLLWVIGSSMGPAHPERDGRAYLQERKYPNELIERVVAGEPLDAATIEQLAGEDNIDVRFLIAQNPALPAHLLDRLTKDASDFVRGGAAWNPHLTREQIQALSADESETTQGYLARNPHVPEADLIRLHEKYEVPLLWFALNPKCPAVLKQKMIDTQDVEALEWLESQAEASANEDGTGSPPTPDVPTEAKPAATTPSGA